MMSHPFQIESLEPRRLLSASVSAADSALSRVHPDASIHPQAAHTVSRFVIGFWGYAFGGTPGTGFGNQWTTNLANAAGAGGGGTAKMFAEEDGPANAESYFLNAIDARHDHIITAADVKNIRLRVIGYSLGGAVAANFTRDLDEAGKTVDGYHLDVAIPVIDLVTLDPVSYPFNFAPLVNTHGPESNVQNFYSYYETGASNGVSTLNLFDDGTNHSEGTYSANDTALPVIGYLHGDSLGSSAGKTSQINVDSGKYAHHPVQHLLMDGIDGELKGIQTDHGTLPFYAYPLALADLLA
jgi:hypothetical protein